jgi:ribosomal protein S18 acetylase RimI-like enzyme
MLCLTPGSAEWADIITQFIMKISAQQGRMYANWAGERLARSIETSAGIVALSSDNKLLGMILFEIVRHTAELSLPWVTNSRLGSDLARRLSATALRILREEHPEVQYLRADRQLLHGQGNPSGLEEVGFQCAWRQRMLLQLPGWYRQLVVPDGYHLHSWDIRDLDLAAAVIDRANAGTLDVKLYSPFFGGESANCRHGLLAILAGKYGIIHAQASQVAWADDHLVGVSFVLDGESGLASVVEISVDPVAQHRGVGRALLTRGLLTLERAGFERVELAVTKENLPARHLYESLDFLPAGDFPVCYWP